MIEGNTIDDEVIGLISNKVYFKYILFSVDHEIYGIDALRVKEIIEFRDVTRVPMIDKTICGVTNLRGSIIPIIDLSLRLRKEVNETSRKTCIIILEFDSKDSDQDGGSKVFLGVKIDAIHSVANFAEEDIQPAPAFGADIPMEFITALGAYKGGFIPLLNIDNILSNEDLEELASNIHYVSNYLR